MKRRQFLLGATALTLSGCVTSSLIDGIERRESQPYQEKISHFLVTPDCTKVVILGEKFHYVLTATSLLANVLTSPWHRRVSASFNYFSVTREGVVRGRYRLSLDAAATDEEKTAARAAGFKVSSSGEIYSEAYISGQRYAAGGFKIPADVQKLNQEYVIQVSEEQARGAKVLGYALTPVTVAADGVLMLLAIPLIPVAYLALRNARWN